MGYLNESCAFLTANRRIVFCGCKRVIKYTDTEIVLFMTDGQVCILGEELLLSTFCGGEIAVTGEIQTLSLQKNERRK
jgi:hypothetical protein